MQQKTSKKKAPRRKVSLWAVLAAVLALVAVIIILVAVGYRNNTDPTNGQSMATGDFQPIPTDPTVKVEDLEDLESDPYKGLQVTKIGSYSGLFVEDGSDDVVTRVLMVIVKNTGKRTIQYAQLELSDGEKTAHFTLSTLPPGESAVLLEQDRMAYADGKDLTEISIQNVAVFGQEPTLCQDKLKIQSLDGVLNVTNISGEDITGDIVIYYKNASSDMLYGGITYRVTIRGGLKADEVKQITASHFTAKGSRVMWVTVS